MAHGGVLSVEQSRGFLPIRPAGWLKPVVAGIIIQALAAGIILVMMVLGAGIITHPPVESIIRAINSPEIIGGFSQWGFYRTLQGRLRHQHGDRMKISFAGRVRKNVRTNGRMEEASFPSPSGVARSVGNLNALRFGRFVNKVRRTNSEERFNVR